MDSMCGQGKLTRSMQVQLAQIYGAGKEKIHIVMPIVNQQRNGFDCGVFAIANAVEFCSNNFEGIEGNKINCVYDHDKLRSHLITCSQWKSHSVPQAPAHETSTFRVS